MSVQLTKRLVATLQSKDRPYEVRDAQVRGLLFRVQPSGHKAWIVTWAHGKRRTLGSSQNLTIDQARAIAAKVIAEFVQTGLPSIAALTPTKMTLAAFLDDHYAPWARTELKGADTYIERTKRVFAPALPMPLTEISARWVEHWWSERIRANPTGATIAKATAWRDLASLRAVLSKAVTWGMLKANPLLGLRVKAAQPRSVVRFLSDAEEDRLRLALQERDCALSTARSSANEWRSKRARPPYPEILHGSFADHLSPIVLLAMNTGLRKGELLALRWSDVNFDARMLTVQRENAKSGKQRHVPLNTEALSALRQWATRSESAEKIFGIADIKSAWTSLLTSANVSNLRFHDLRHHFASRLVTKGVDLNTVRELLGHGDIKMTLRYAHLGPSSLAAAVAKLGD